MKEDPARKCREMVNTDGVRAFMAYLDHLIEQEKENLVNQRGEAADEARGFIKKTRQALNSVRIKPAQKKGNVYI